LAGDVDNKPGGQGANVAEEGDEFAGESGD